MSEESSHVTTGRGVQWGHLTFLAGVLGFLGYYLRDSWLAQASVSNLIFVLPVTLLSVFTVVVIGIALVRRKETAQGQGEQGGQGGQG